MHSSSKTRTHMEYSCFLMRRCDTARKSQLTKTGWANVAGLTGNNHESICDSTFDLHNAESEDYDKAYSSLSRLGFSKYVRSDKGNSIRLPASTCAGCFIYTKAGLLRKKLAMQVQQAFEKEDIVANVFIAVGGDWAWIHRKSRSILQRISSILSRAK